MSLYLGLISGTSMDGIDAAILDTKTLRLIYGLTYKYSANTFLKIQELVSSTSINLELLCQLNILIGREFAEAANLLLNKAGILAQDIIAIGSHGQTICHNTQSLVPYTLQLGCAHTISSLTQITVVADFRSRDLANGGQGAPFAPLFHQEIFQRYNQELAVINLGGISNITIIEPGHDVKGWDIGPANCLMDAWIYKHLGKAYDHNGIWASQGRCIDPLLEKFLQDPFIQLPTPKSVGKEYFSLSWLEQFLLPSYTAVDVQKTLLTFTAQILVDTLRSVSNSFECAYLCGGGSHNVALCQMITQSLPNTLIQNTSDIGVDPDYLEAMLFAWLASKTMNMQTLNLSKVTGSKKPAILGAIYPNCSKQSFCLA